MKCIVVVAGREAIPVRAIPFITGWMVSPDVVASGFAMTDRWITRLQDLVAFHLSADGHHHLMLPKEWDGIEADLRILSETLKAREKVEGDGYPEWRDKSILMLPSRCFVWRDEFERAFNRAYSPDKVILIDERPGDRDLNFAPRIPHAALGAVFDGFPVMGDGADRAHALAAEAAAQRDFEAGFHAARVDLPLYARAPELSAEAFSCVINAVEPSKWKDERSRLNIDAKTVKAIQSALKQAECDIDSGVLAPRNSPVVWLGWGRRRDLHRGNLNRLDGQIRLHPAWENFESAVRRFETWQKAQEQRSTVEQVESSAPTPVNGLLDRADDEGPADLAESAQSEAQVEQSQGQVGEQSALPARGRMGPRKVPSGGDALTSEIWEICYDLHERGSKTTPRWVMPRLKQLVGVPGSPVVGDVAGGVQYENGAGEQAELSSEALRGRIREWRKACLAPDSGG